MGAILSGDRISDFGKIEVVLEDGLLEIPLKHRGLYSPSAGYVLRKTSEAQSKHHPYIGVYTKERWDETLFLLAEGGANLADFIKNKTKVEARVVEGVHILALPEDCLKHLKLRGDIVTVLRSISPRIQLWAPEEFREYERILRYSVGFR